MMAVQSDVAHHITVFFMSFEWAAHSNCPGKLRQLGQDEGKTISMGVSAKPCEDNVLLPCCSTDGRRVVRHRIRLE